MNIEKLKTWLKKQYKLNKHQYDMADDLSDRDYFEGAISAIDDVLCYIEQKEKQL